MDKNSNFMEKWLKLDNKSHKKPKIDLTIKKKLTKEKTLPKPKSKIKKPKKILKRKPIPKAPKSSIVVDDTPKFSWIPGMVRNPPPRAGLVTIPEGDKGCLKGLKFVITGTLESLERDDAKDLILKYGGRVTGQVSGLTSFLVKGDDAGPSKIKRAVTKNVKIIDEADLLNLIRSNSPIASSRSKKTKNSEIKNEPKTIREETIQINKDKNNQKSTFEIPNAILKTEKNGIETTSNQKANDLLCEKYRPKTTREIVGNSRGVKQIRDFLLTFGNIPEGRKIRKNAILISGPPGVGKTSSVYAIASDLGMEVIEMNASDSRSKKALDSSIKASLSNTSVSRFFGVSRQKRLNGRKKLILMEEVDGMSGGDYGGVPELIKFIKETEYPIFCTCNDRSSTKIRSLAGHCVGVEFTKPTLQQIIPRIDQITQQENIKIEKDELIQLIRRSDCDLRLILNTLEFQGSFKADKHSNPIKDLDALRRYKDSSLTQWQAAQKLFERKIEKNPKFHYNELIECYFVDPMFVTLLVQENYLQHKLTGRKSLESYSKAAEFLASGDIVDRSIYGEQNFSLMPFHAIMSSVAPASIVSKGSKPFRLNFPAWLGKNSTRNKNKRLMNELFSKMNPHFSISPNTMKTDQAEYLKDHILKPLVDRGKSGVDESIERLMAYSLSKENSDSLIGICEYETNRNKIKLDSKVKSAFTRKYNSENGSVDAKSRRIKKAKKKSSSGYADDGFIASSEESDESFETVPKKRKMKRVSTVSKRGRGNKRGKGKSKKIT